VTPLVLDPEGWTQERLRTQATRLCQGLDGLVAHFSRLPEPMPNPWALEAGLDLARRSTELARGVLDRADASPTLLARVVNQLYEVGNSMPVFLRFAEAPPPAVRSGKSTPG